MICQTPGNGPWRVYTSNYGVHTLSISVLDSSATIVKLPIEYHQNSNIINGSNTGALKSSGASTSSGQYSFAEGYETDASGNYSHAEGSHTVASGKDGSHAEGYYTKASSNCAHAEGSHTTASGIFTHAEGYYAVASGWYSHAEGSHTEAFGEYQHVQGKLNVRDSANTYAHIVGNGTDLDERSNAHTLDWDGNAWFAGDVYVGSTSGTNKDEGSKKLATEEFVETEVAALVGSAPETLDTIEELATALNNNKDIVTVLNDSIATKANKADVYTKAEVDAAIAAAIEAAFANIARAEEMSF